MKLWLIRHGDARQGKAGERDFDRDLSERGAADAERFGRWLANHADKPQWIVSSDAVRARVTASWVARGAGAGAGALQLDRRLYDASAASLLDIARETPAHVQSLALVGHNPGMSQLAKLLPADNTQPALPPLGAVLIDSTGSWHELVPGPSTIVSFTHPGGGQW